MTKQILAAIWPCLVALAIALVVLLAIVRFGGWKLNLARIRNLHRDRRGGVQSLAFVLTFPILLFVTMFIVQVSQLMIGVMTVNYAAFATARSATVWIPTHTDTDFENRFAPMTPGQPFVMTIGNMDPDNEKQRHIFQSALMALAPVCPSRDLGLTTAGNNAARADAATRAYYLLAPGTQNNGRIVNRVQNKLAYAAASTAVRIQFLDKDSDDGPTYNPNDPDFEWDPNEVGWQDPLQVTVTHEFGLLPGPGRLLAKYLVRADGRPDRIAPRINQNGRQIYTTTIWATATLTNEGMKSVTPYIQAPR